MKTEVSGQTKVFIKKQVKDLMNGDVILHPIFRLDGLMLVKQYKILSFDLAHKIKKQVPHDLYALVLSSDYTFENYIENKLYNDPWLIKEQEQLSEIYSKSLNLDLNKDSFVDNRANIESEIEENTDSKYARNDDFVSYLFKLPFFNSFEKKLESTHLKERAVKLRESLVNIILEDIDLYNELNRLKNYRDIILVHSINTTATALMIGLTLELTDENLLDLALTTLLIDISVTKIPTEEFDMRLKRKLSNQDFYKLLLAELKKLADRLPVIRKETILCGILDHYEYYDGSGYPNGKKASDINLYGRIISIAHAYDEIVGGYFYNDGAKPTQALQHIWEKGGSVFDPNVLRIFIDRTLFLKTGQQITLNNFQQGMIIGFRDFVNYPLSPMIQLKDGSIINL
ncbi:HD-GYP domain-containing protein [Alkaliphilus transvaalensis]|uniref:HD-GYP domain-containing protein n=1 Tax=Alkaliphilus transvaalensis TaxID=114628 RepID=UPI00047B1958|nr:HD domain-containing phosphohydrolase [Alkaliphilus transvaalensis]